jgi:hypothetical protein
MKSITILLALAFLLLACSKSEQNTQTASTSANETSNLISCTGIGELQFTMNEQDMIQKFGKENIKRDSIFAEGTFVAFATVVWSNTPKEVWVTWRDSVFQKVGSMEIRQTNSPYQTAQGLKNGVNLDAVVAANGGTPISFSGFGWDYGGWLQSLKGGKLEKEIPCITMWFDLPENTSNVSTEGIMGETEVNSDNPIFKQLKPQLLTLVVNNRQ